MGLTVLLLFFSSLATLASGCSSDADCGSGDYTQPGSCQAGVCQCGVGYAGNQPIDPTSCSLQCVPVPVPDSITFLVEPNVTVTAAGGSLVLDVLLQPYLKQIPTTVALLNPVNGSACRLLPEALGQGQWAQTVESALAGQCNVRDVYSAPFLASVGSACWNTLPSVTEVGSQYAISFNQYQTQVEVVQQGVAPFGQVAQRRRQLQANETIITRAFRRDYTISVATSFTAQSSPFSLYQANITEPTGPTAVDDAATTNETFAVSIDVLSNDQAGTNPLLVSSLSVSLAPAHGTASVINGLISYQPSGFYYGPDSFQYQICDNYTLCSSALVSVTVLPLGPLAVADSAYVPFQGSVDVDVLSNDIAGVAGIVALTIASSPASGSAIVTNQRSINFTAGAGFTGLVSFSYQICDASVPAPLCSIAQVLINVGGLGPIAVPDVASVNEDGSVLVPVLANDRNGTAALNPASVAVVSGASHGTTSVDASTGNVLYTPAPGYYGSDSFTYQVCDLTSPVALCANATVSVTINGVGPMAYDDLVHTPYLKPVTVLVLANDTAGAQPLQPGSVSIVQNPLHGSASVRSSDGAVTYTPASGFTGADTLKYQVCDNSLPAPLCSTAILTVIVDSIPTTVVALRYRLVKIDYDVLGHAIRATVQTETPASAKVANVALWAGASTGISSVIAGPSTGPACDPSSPAGFCDQFHVVTFSDTPCSVSNAILVLSADFQCANGANPATCGYTGFKLTYKLDNLVLTYDACPRVVQYGVDAAQSALTVNTDVARQNPVTVPQLQNSVVYGRCSIVPSFGSTFATTKLNSLHAIHQTASGPVDMGDLLGSARLLMISSLVQSDPSNPKWDFDLTLDSNFFALTETYYLEANIALTFTNTGVLSKRLVIPLVQGRSLRSQLGSSLAMQRQVPTAPVVTGIFSNTFRAAVAAPTTSSQAGVAATTSSGNGGGAVAATSAPSSSGLVAAVAGGVAAAVVAAAVIIIVVVVRRRRRRAEERNSGTPLGTDLPAVHDLDL